MDEVPFYDGNPSTPYKGVAGGFRAGKRRKGNSLLKRKPRTSTTVTYYRIVDSDGETVVRSAGTFKYNKPS